MTHKGQEVAYLRVSSENQSTDRQEDLRAEADRTFEEKASASTRNRPQLIEMMKYVREGDRITVWSMDRLARSLHDLENLVRELTAKGVRVRFLKENLEFTPDKDDHYATFQLQVLGAVAQLERSIIRERQREGIEKAKAKGVYKGRVTKLLTDVQVAEAKERIAAQVPKAVIARDLGVSRNTLYRALAEAKK